MKSMTGYGQAKISSSIGDFEINISCTNHRFLDFKILIPQEFFSFEKDMRKIMSEVLYRGSCILKIIFYKKEEVLEFEKLKKRKRFLEKIKKELKIKEEITISHLLLQEKDFLPKNLLKEERKKFFEGLKKALKNVDIMRKKEGEILKKELKIFLKRIKENILKIEKKSSDSCLKYEEKLKNKISKFLEEEDERVLKEIAIFADKVDIKEEVIRIKSHIKQFFSLLEKEKIGKKMNFLLLEILREVNTIASKSLDYNISKIVIDIKDDLEKIKEQVQNIL